MSGEAGPRSNPFHLDPESVSVGSDTGGQIGSQRPTNYWVPKYSSTRDADRAMRFLDMIGFHLDPWQELVLRDMLGRRDDGKFGAREACLLVSRQQGKTAILEARAIVALLVLKEPLTIHTSVLFPSCREAYFRTVARLKACPDTKALIDSGAIKLRSGNDNMGLEFEGRRILYMARGKDPIRGFSPDVVILDEAYALDDETVAAVKGALSSHPSAQLIFTSSTGLDDSDTLLRIRDRGLHEDPSLALFEWCADTGCDLDDRAQWFKANPALGIRLDLETVESERATMPDKQFGRERLGLWADNKFRAVINLDLWNTLGKSDSQITSRYVLAVDASPDREMASTALAGFTADGRKQIEIDRTGRGLSWCVKAIEELYQATRNPPPLAICVQAGASAGRLIPELEKIRDRDGNPAEVIAFGTRDVTDACGFLYDSVDDETLVHLNDQSLLAALSGATRINVGKLDGPKGEEEYRAWYFGRKDPLVDITPLCAGTYALWGLNQKQTEADLMKPHYEGKPKGGRLW